MRSRTAVSVIEQVPYVVRVLMLSFTLVTSTGAAPCSGDKEIPPVATIPSDAVRRLQEFQREQDRSGLHGASPRPGGRQAYLWRCGRLVERLHRCAAASEIHRVGSRSA